MFEVRDPGQWPTVSSLTGRDSRVAALLAMTSIAAPRCLAGLGMSLPATAWPFAKTRAVAGAMTSSAGGDHMFCGASFSFVGQMVRVAHHDKSGVRPAGQGQYEAQSRTGCHPGFHRESRARGNPAEWAKNAGVGGRLWICDLRFVIYYWGADGESCILSLEF
jgi:hypothetical protein